MSIGEPSDDMLRMVAGAPAQQRQKCNDGVQPCSSCPIGWCCPSFECTQSPCDAKCATASATSAAAGVTAMSSAIAMSLFNTRPVVSFPCRRVKGMAALARPRSGGEPCQPEQSQELPPAEQRSTSVVGAVGAHPQHSPREDKLVGVLTDRSVLLEVSSQSRWRDRLRPSRSFPSQLAGAR
jgi:hypothetical protein